MWMSEENFDQVKQGALALTPEQRAALTWSQAYCHIPGDTLKIAEFQGYEAGGLLTPWQAVCRCNGITAEESRGDEGISHIAGLVVYINNAAIQRCALCGAKLIDTRNQAAAVDESGEVPKVPVWPVNALVCVVTGNPTSYRLVSFGPGAGEYRDLPEDSCLEFA